MGVISAHGTGTVYNDQMEMRAFRTVFQDRERPVYSIKGGIGHTMGAAGLVEMIIALCALRERKSPPTVNLKDPDDDARGWVSDHQQPVREQTLALVTNAGFSGVNTALLLGLINKYGLTKVNNVNVMLRTVMIPKILSRNQVLNRILDCEYSCGLQL